MAKLKFDKAVVAAILAGDHPASAWLSGQGDINALSREVAISAIEAARQQQAGALLDAARSGAKDKAVRKAAGAALHRLKSAGVTVARAPSQATAWSPRADLDAPPPPAALIGLPDPNGYFPFILVSYSRGDACASVGLAGAGRGHIDAEHGHLSRSDARTMLSSNQAEQGLRAVPFHVALHFIQRAFEEAGVGQPHGFDHLLESVPEGVKNSARLIDPLEGQEAEIDSDALHAAEPLLDPANGLYLALPEEDAYSAITAIGEAMNSPLELDEESRSRRAEAAIDEAADSYLTELSRRTWALALDVASFIAFREGDEDMRRTARANALALRAGTAGRDVPFVRGWVHAQLYSMVQMFIASQGGATGAGPGLGEEGEGGEPAPDSGVILTD